MNDLISRQAAIETQPKQDEFIKLTVRNSNGRPYYSIIYLEFDDNGVGHDFEGYSSYSLDVISDYLKKYFMPSAHVNAANLPPNCHQIATDCISRQAAIDALIADGRNVDSRYLESERIIHEADAVEVISMLPSAHPERKKGRWISRDGEEDCYECSECHAVIEGDEVYWRNNYFCYNCGADMRGESDE